ncbi:MAG: hypothetical protein AAGA92_11250 [Planctomycetota bacterium]
MPRIPYWILLVGLATANPGLAFGESEPSAEKPARARPPEWGDEAASVFFTDVRDVLVGERPSLGDSSRRTEQSSPDQRAPGIAWSDAVPGDVVITEIKRTVGQLEASLASPGKFRGGGNAAAEKHFRWLALLFAIVEEFDAEVRWKREAAGLRNYAAAVAEACSGTDESAYQRASLAGQDFADLVRGQRPAVSENPSADDWSQLADMSLVMRRMELSLENRVKAALANRKSFRRLSDEASHEAALLAMLASATVHEGSDYAGDDDFETLARKLQVSSRDLMKALENREYETAQQSGAAVTRSCAECHDSYRG